MDYLTKKCPGCGWHMVPQQSGDESPDWEECKNPDCDYDEEVEEDFPDFDHFDDDYDMNAV